MIKRIRKKRIEKLNNSRSTLPLKVLLIASTVIGGADCARAADGAHKTLIDGLLKYNKKPFARECLKTGKLPNKPGEIESTPEQSDVTAVAPPKRRATLAEIYTRRQPAEFEEAARQRVPLPNRNRAADQPENEVAPGADRVAPGANDFAAAAVGEKFHWKPALIQSGMFLAVQHGFRMSQKRTRRELDGEFFGDWARSVKSLRGWRDGDKIFINYVAHPLQGSFTGRIFINHSDRAKKLEFGKSKQYWESRFKAMLWTGAWSTQFEIGPISEASIGNVGMNSADPHKMAWVDMVVTPVVGTALLVQEDAIDKYVLKNWLERRSGGRLTKKIKLLRSVLTPTLSLSNIINAKVPWKRSNR